MTYLFISEIVVVAEGIEIRKRFAKISILQWENIGTLQKSEKKYFLFSSYNNYKIFSNFLYHIFDFEIFFPRTNIFLNLVYVAFPIERSHLVDTELRPERAPL